MIMNHIRHEREKKKWTIMIARAKQDKTTKTNIVYIKKLKTGYLFSVDAMAPRCRAIKNAESNDRQQHNSKNHIK